VNVADRIFQHLAGRGVRDIFTVTGGGIMHLVDALGRNPDIAYWCNYHEQASAIAAESYARLTGRIGVCLVTSGPGATNALSGLASAWMDSAPVLILAGQVRRDLIADYSKWRQLGPQEVNATAMASPVTKRVFSLASPTGVATLLDEALATALSNRPGPVWVDVPLDVQGTELPPESSPRGAAPTSQPEVQRTRCALADLEDVVGALRTSERPTIVCGKGIRLAGAVGELDEMVRLRSLPVVSTIGGMDVLPEDHPLYFGRFGPTGQRRANFLVQNADLLLCLGTGLSIAAIGFDTSGFAPTAKKILVNVDGGELTKPHLKPDMTIQCDLREFLSALREHAGAEADLPKHEEWLAACRDWKGRYPLVTPDYTADTGHVNSYYLAHRLSRQLGRDDVVLTGNSLDAHSVFHSFAVTEGQRVFTNTNYGAMGWDLPALVGACVGHGDGRVVLVTGDGSIQFNIQELLTVGRHRMNAHIFVLNNGGYQAIRATQRTFCEGRLVGCDASSGVFTPSFRHLAAAYGIRYTTLSTNDDVDARLPEILVARGPSLCEVNVGYEQERLPRVMSRRLADGTLRSGALENQYPFLPPDEVSANMRVSRPRGAHDEADPTK
jgi:acetolactate synthase I/II/III large subunit